MTCMVSQCICLLKPSRHAFWPKGACEFHACPLQAYEAVMFREALKTGWYDLLAARDAYRVACDERGLHRDLAARFLEARLLSPPGIGRRPSLLLRRPMS